MLMEAQAVLWPLLNVRRSSFVGFGGVAWLILSRFWYMRWELHLVFPASLERGRESSSHLGFSWF